MPLTLTDSRLIELFVDRIWITLTNESKGQRSVISYAVNYGWFLRGFIEITTSAQRACSLKTRDNFHFREALNRVSHSTDLVYVIQINTVFYPRLAFLKAVLERDDHYLFFTAWFPMIFALSYFTVWKFSRPQFSYSEKFLRLMQ